MLRQARALQRIVLRKFERHRLLRAHARHRARHPALYDGNDAILARYHADGGLNHDYQDYKLACLRALLRDRRPLLTLELGSGSTTPVFADYVRATPGARLVTVDESPDYLRQAAEIAGIERGDLRFSLVVRQRELVRDAAGRVSEMRYLGSFPDAYDMVFIDGPSSVDEQGKKNKQALASNIFDILQQHLPRTIVVDGRHATVTALMERFGDRYEAYPTDLMRGRIRPDYRYFSIFHLKE